MSYRLLLSGHKPTFELFTFEPSHHAGDEGKLDRVSTPPAPPSTTWLERSPIVPNVIYASSETEHEVYSLVVERDDVRVTSKRATKCTWPVHLTIAKDGSGLVTGGLGSGETVHIPLETYGTLSQTSDSPLLTYGEAYSYSTPTNPSPYGNRQKGPHVHGVELNAAGDKLYICDLGSDAIWRAEPSQSREGEVEWKVTGKMGGQRGMTPRHSVLSPDERYLYVNSELQSKLHVFDTTTLALVSSFDLTPPHLARSVRSLLLTAELYAHPVHRRTLYVSLRGTQRMDKMAVPRGAGPGDDASSTTTQTDDDADLVAHGPPADDLPNGEKGDSIAIILLNEDGSAVERVQHVQTGLDWPRGMRITDDGRYLAVAGEFGEGGIEVYEISGERGEVFTLVARDETVRDVNCVLWL